MRTALLSASIGTLVIASSAVAQDPAAGLYRSGQPSAMPAGVERTGQPVTLTPQRRTDPNAGRIAGFSAAYRRAKAPRMVIFWNRELTDDLDTDREAYIRTSSEAHMAGNSRQTDYATPYAQHSDSSVNADSNSSSEMRVGVDRLDRGARTSTSSEARDFDVERGFSDALAEAGVRLVDRTAIMRTSALGRDLSNVQSIETKAILGHAEITLEVIALGDPRAPTGTSYKIVARNLAQGRLVANVLSSGNVPTGPAPYVAGPNGFVRAAPRLPGAYAIGRQVALDTMAALSSRL